MKVATGRSSVWLERTVRDREVAGSNPVAPTTRSFALARLRRHREAFLDPRLPQRCLAGDGFGRLIAVMVEVHRNHALAAHVVGAKGGYARPRLVDPQQGVVRILGDVLRHAAERRHTRGRRPTLPD